MVDLGIQTQTSWTQDVLVHTSQRKLIVCVRQVRCKIGRLNCSPEDESEPTQEASYEVVESKDQMQTPLSVWYQKQ